MTWSGCDAVPVDVAAPMNTGPLENVEIPVTWSCVMEPIPPITDVETPALLT